MMTRLTRTVSTNETTYSNLLHWHKLGHASRVSLIALRIANEKRPCQAARAPFDVLPSPEPITLFPRTVVADRTVDHAADQPPGSLSLRPPEKAQRRAAAPAGPTPPGAPNF